MATTSKKTPKKSQAKPRALSASASIAELNKTIAAQALEIRQGAEQQAATSEILHTIARAPTGRHLIILVNNLVGACSITSG